jgi:hypothetical protein
MTKARVAVLALLSMCSAATAQISDTMAPVLVEFDFSPTAVNAIGGPGETTVTARVTDDLSGTSGISARFFSPTGIQNQTAFMGRISGDELDGVYQGVLSIPEFSEDGVWTASVFVNDFAGNFDTFSAPALSGLGFPFQLTVTSNEDTTPPTIASVTFTPSAVDVSAGPQVVNVALQIEDDVAGVDLQVQDFGDFTITFLSPGGIQRQRLFNRQFAMTSGDGLDGVWEAEFTLPQFSEAGQWSIESLAVRDRVNNFAFLPNAVLGGLGIAATIDVTSVPEDTTPPTLLDLTFTPAFINTSAGSANVVVSYQASDDLSGVAFVPDTPNSAFVKGVIFSSPSGGQFNRFSSPFGGITLTGGTPLNGTWQGSVFFPQFSEDGDWRISFFLLEDAVRNQLRLNTAQLDARGVPRLVIIRPSLDSDGVVGGGGGEISDDTFGDRAKISFPAGALAGSTDVAIDVLQDPLNIPNPSGFVAPGTSFVNIELTPEPAFPLAAPGLTVVLPVIDPLPPGTVLSLFKVDEATATLVPAIGVDGLPVTGTVDPSGLSATFTGIASLSTVVGLVPGGASVPTFSELLTDIEALNTSSGSMNYLSFLLNNAQNYLGQGNNKTARSRLAALISEIVSLSNIQPGSPHRLDLDEANELIQRVALLLFTIPVDPAVTPAPPASSVTTISELQQEIAALQTSSGSKNYLNQLAANAGLYLNQGNNTTARSRLASFIAEVVNFSNRAPADANRILLDEGNELIQGAINALAGVALP